MPNINSNDVESGVTVSMPEGIGQLILWPFLCNKLVGHNNSTNHKIQNAAEWFVLNYLLNPPVLPYNLSVSSGS
jgi:hypothetical protein